MASNVLGSNITNILLVLGIAGQLGKGTCIKRVMLHIDLPMVPASAILLGFLISNGSLTLMDAMLCLIGTVIYLYSAIATDVAPDAAQHRDEQLAARVWIRLLGSLVLILLSAKFTVYVVGVLAVAMGVGTRSLL